MIAKKTIMIVKKRAIKIMRSELAKINNHRDKFYGHFERFGQKSNYKTGKPEITVLLLDIRDKTGKQVTDHLWFNFTKGFQEIHRKEPLQTGELIQFEARIKPYTKGYEKDQLDYKLSHPSKIHKNKTLKFREENERFKKGLNGLSEDMEGFILEQDDHFSHNITEFWTSFWKTCAEMWSNGLDLSDKQLEIINREYKRFSQTNLNSYVEGLK